LLCSDLIGIATEREGRERGKEGKRERGKEGKRERGKEGKRKEGKRER
jgi:hypothetical protein